LKYTTYTCSGEGEPIEEGGGGEKRAEEGGKERLGKYRVQSVTFLTEKIGKQVVRKTRQKMRGRRKKKGTEK